MALLPDDLEAFLVVVREKSFGRAASSLLVSQPTVSERIARLERSVGADLFIRGPRGVSLTSSGERLHLFAQRILALMEEAVESVRTDDRPTPLRVGVHSTFAYRAVPLVVGALGNTTRGVRFRDAHSDQIIGMLLDGILDAGFVLPGARPPALRFDPLPPDPVVCACSPAHALASGRSIPLRAVFQHNVALNLWGTGADEFGKHLGSAATSGRRIECSDAGSAVRLARDHGYLAFVVESVVEGEVAAGTLTILKVRGLPTWSVQLGLASSARVETPDEVESLRRSLRQSARARARGAGLRAPTAAAP
jgi:DNA-binding transcriptional LysR family regulator